MDRIRELQHTIAMIDAAINNLPDNYSEDVRLAVERQRQLQKKLHQEVFELSCIEAIRNTPCLI